jgi:XTP/dITP diphosphohydrolase
MQGRAIRIVLATSNPHKIQEVAEIIEPLGLRVVGLDELGEAAKALAEPEEDGETFADNARLKARYYARHLGERCLAEDSGLVVDALGGAPGVRSARYAGVGGERAERDARNNAKLLADIAGVPAAARTARFVCAMCLADPDGAVVAETSGSYDGMITSSPRGQNGFGYDPLLLLPDLGKTSAELSPEEKNARSHRGKAARAMAARLRAIGEAGGG